MSTTVSYIVSSILAFGFHALVVGLLMLNWGDDEIIESLSTQRYYIEATLVRENPYAVKKRQEQARKDAEQKTRISMRRGEEKKARLKREAIEKAKRLDLEKQIPERIKEEEARNQEEKTITVTNSEI